MKGALSAVLLLASAIACAHAAPIYPPYPYAYPCTSYGTGEGNNPCSAGGSPYTKYDFLTLLTAKYKYGPNNRYGWWFDWQCKGGYFGVWKNAQGVLVDGPVEKNKEYNKACLPPVPTPAGWNKEINCNTDLSCPGETGCMGRQCFGSMWLSSVGYDGMMRSYADCVNDPIHCKEPWSSRFGTPDSFKGPWMNPKTKNPEPPFGKNTVWPA